MKKLPCLVGDATRIGVALLFARRVVQASRQRTWAAALAPAFATTAALLLAGCEPSAEDRLIEIRAMQANNEMEASIPLLIELIESGHRTGEIFYRYGRALSLSGKPERSVWALDAAREDPEWFVRASQQLAIDAHRGGNYEFAIQIFERLHAEAPEAGEGDYFGSMLEARVFLDSQNHFEEALALLDEVLEKYPDDETAIRLKAVALLGLKRPDDAYELLRAAAVLPEDDATDAADAAGEEAIASAGAADASTAAAAAAGDGAAGEGAAAGDAAGAGDRTVAGAGDRTVAGAGGAGSEGVAATDGGTYLAVEGDAREAYWCAVRSSFKREAGEADEAAQIIDACLGRHPAASELLTEAVKLYSQLGRPDRVREILEKAYEASPDDPQVRSAYVQYLDRLGRRKDVEMVLRKAVDDAIAAGRGGTVETAALWTDLAGFLMADDRVGEALLAFDAVNEILGDSASPDLLLREAEALIRAKEYDQALAMAAKTPVEIHRLMLRGRIAYERGQYQEALDLLGEAALAWPNNGPIRYYRARAAEALGQFDLAIEEYRQCIRSDTALADARVRLAKLHVGEGNPREAGVILAFQSPRRPSNPTTEMRILMVEVEMLRGSEPNLDIPPDAEWPIERVRVETARALGRGLARRTNAKVAASVLSELEKQAAPPIRGYFLRERVSWLIESGDVDLAVAAARDGLVARPEDVDSQLALARALLADEEGKSPEAERLLRRVLEQRPDDVDALKLMGDLETAAGANERADEMYGRALIVDPERWDALAPLVEHLSAAGRSDEALRRLEEFVRRDAPSEGRAALELARRRAAQEGQRERAVALARQAVRFGGGQEAVDLLVSLDPAAAAAFTPVATPAAEPASAGGPAEKATAEDRSRAAGA